MQLCLIGVREVDGEMTALLSQQAKDGRYVGFLHPHLTDPWADVLASPEQASAAVVACLDSEGLQLSDLLSSAMAKPAPAPVLNAMWHALREQTQDAPKEHKVVAFGALFSLSPQVPREERLAMREDFRRFFEACPVPLIEWPTKAMKPRGEGLSLRPGDGIPWEADRLSAALSWASEIKRETDPFPADGVAESSNGVFSYVAQAFVSYAYEPWLGAQLDPYDLKQPTPLSKWKRQPLQLPLEPTPWQRARALHREHPELPWPDRMGFRPRQKW
jgi:hypothetical protein